MGCWPFVYLCFCLELFVGRKDKHQCLIKAELLSASDEEVDAFEFITF